MSKQDLINKIKKKAEQNRGGKSASSGKVSSSVETTPRSGAPGSQGGLENLWIDYPRKNPNAKLRLFCFHYAGGSSAIYRDWKDRLPDDVEICAIQLPGREKRMTESPYRDFYPMIQALAKAIRPLLDDRFAFFGHCMGALTSFELARQLRRTDAPLPEHMFVSSFIGPQLQPQNPKSDIMRISGDQIDEFFEILGGTPDEILENLGLMSMNRPILQADVDLLNGYEYVNDAPLDIPISAFGATNDKLVYVDEIEAWRDQTTKDFRFRVFPGDHFFLFSHQAWLMENLSERLKQIIA